MSGDDGEARGRADDEANQPATAPGPATPPAEPAGTVTVDDGVVAVPVSGSGPASSGRDELLEGFTPRRPFVDDVANDAPNRSGVHVVWGPDGALLYVGENRRIRSRLRQHLTGDRAASVLADHVGSALGAGRDGPAGADEVAEWLGGCEVAWKEVPAPKPLRDQIVSAFAPEANRMSTATLAGTEPWWVEPARVRATGTAVADPAADAGPRAPVTPAGAEVETGTRADDQSPSAPEESGSPTNPSDAGTGPGPIGEPSGPVDRASRPGLLNEPRPSTQVSVIVGIIAALSAVGGLLADGHPSASSVADAVLRAGLAVALVLAASRATRSAWIIAAGITALAATGGSQVAAVTALLLAGIGSMLRLRSRLIGAAVGALVAQALLRLPADGPISALHHHGATALVAIGVTGLLVVSGYRRSTTLQKRRARMVGIGLVAVSAVAALVVGAAVLVTRDDIDDGLARSRRGLTAARDADTAKAATDFAAARSSLDRANRVLGGPWMAPVKAVPIVGQHAKALDVMTANAAGLTAVAEEASRRGDYHDLRYQSGRFDLDMMIKLRGPLQRTAAALGQADHQATDLPSEWLAPPVQAKVDSFIADVRDARPDAELASEAVTVGPDVFGAHGDRRYLVLLTNPAEQRGLGGFIGAYGELTASEGRMRLTRSGPIDELISAVPAGRRKLNAPADYVRRYRANEPQDFLQDLTLSPDFPSVAGVAADLYNQSTQRRVDGVIQLDPFGLAALLEITGPVEVKGLDEPLSADNAAELLLRRQYLDIPQSSTRQDLMQSALKATFERLTKGDLPGPKRLGDLLGPQARAGHVMLWMDEPAEQSVAETVHADGAMPSAAGADLLSVRAQNSAHNKIDAYLVRAISAKVTLDPSTSLVRTTVKVSLTNRAPRSGMPPYVIGNTVGLPSGTNRMTLSVYSPLSPTGATVDGRRAGVRAEDELGLVVSSLRVQVPASSTVTVVFELQGQMRIDGRYRLLLVPQPAATRTTASVAVGALPGWRVTGVKGLETAGGRATAQVRLDEPTQLVAGVESTR